MEYSTHLSMIVLLIISSFISLLPQSATGSSLGEEEEEGFSLELIHRDSIHSPLYQGNLSTTERIRRLVRLSESRHASVAGPQEVNIRPVVGHIFTLYTVKVRIGSRPGVDVHLLLDTASGLVWTQCDPCRHCFPQEGQKYKPAASRTFVPLARNHPLCHQFENGKCAYEMVYADGKYTRGALATETLSFAARGGGLQAVPGIVFGCSDDSSSSMFPSLSAAAIGGILALNGERHSLLLQLGTRIRGRFSYCLVPPQRPGHSYLSFGTDIPSPPRSGNVVQSTPFVRGHRPNYYVKLSDISVNGVRLNLPPGTFDFRPDGTGGFLIDVGSEISFLVRPAYAALKSALVAHFGRFNLVRVDGDDEDLDLCYRMRTGFAGYPWVELHFEGANLRLGKKALFYFIHQTSKFCLFLKPVDNDSVLGAAQQGNRRFVYDFVGNRIYFHKEVCHGR